MEKRNWKHEAVERARQEGEQLETLMRSILRLFADGCLVYRSRENQAPSVETKSERLRRLRATVARPTVGDVAVGDVA